jgi:hypothetical protein
MNRDDVVELDWAMGSLEVCRLIKERERDLSKKGWTGGGYCRSQCPDGKLMVAASIHYGRRPGQVRKAHEIAVARTKAGHNR